VLGEDIMTMAFLAGVFSKLGRGNKAAEIFKQLNSAREG